MQKVTCSLKLRTQIRSVRRLAGHLEQVTAISYTEGKFLQIFISPHYINPIFNSMESEYRNAFYEERERMWKQAEQEADRIIDRLGKRIDRGIKESVVALRLLGFITTGSCEGHLDHGLPGPWIDVGEVPEDVLTMFKEARKDPSKLDERKKALFRETIQKGAEEKARLIELLAEFYQTRKVPFDQMLTFQYTGGDDGRLITQGTEVYKAYDKTARAERLNRYQEEMRAFTHFAKSKFLYEIGSPVE